MTRNACCVLMIAALAWSACKDDEAAALRAELDTAKKRQQAFKDELKKKEAEFDRQTQALANPKAAAKAVPAKEPKPKSVEPKEPPPPQSVKLLDLTTDVLSYDGKSVQVRGRLGFRNEHNQALGVRHLHTKCDSTGPAGDQLLLSVKSSSREVRLNMLRWPRCKSVYIVGTVANDDGRAIVFVEQVSTRKIRAKRSPR